ncbi:hypothetical protein IMY05_C4642000400 [Salix suchowensis]|nr:hypothetical protein IMY05_C4642000400 [Salix suchowensis]
MATRSEKEIFELHSQTSHLQTRNSELEVEVKRLQNENAELERIMVVQTSEMETVVQARDDALKKLRRMRRVARDLMDEKKVSFEFNGGVDLRGHIQGWTQLESPLIQRSASGSMSESLENSSAVEDSTTRLPGDPYQRPFVVVASCIKASTACAELIRAKWNSKSEPLIPKSAPVTKPVSRTVPSTRATSPVPGREITKRVYQGVTCRRACVSGTTSRVYHLNAQLVDQEYATTEYSTSSDISRAEWKLNTNKPPHLPMIKEALRIVRIPITWLAFMKTKLSFIIQLGCWLTPYLLV